MEINLVRARKLDHEINEILKDKNLYGLFVRIDPFDMDIQSHESNPEQWDQLYTEMRLRQMEFEELVTLRFSLRLQIDALNHECGISELLNEISLKKALLARHTAIVNVSKRDDRITKATVASTKLASLRNVEDKRQRFYGGDECVTLYPFSEIDVKQHVIDRTRMRNQIIDLESQVTEKNHNVTLVLTGGHFLILEKIGLV